VDVSDTVRRVPAHLRRFVVRQDYDAYTAVDHAVWRFVLLQMYDRLASAAHPAYARGLLQTGMSVERIPSISEMDACLSQLGWGAVCVDGFIPPRAFQEFQALRILPIAAEIRSVEHLPYTPAPDVIHEAAGHAPILPDPNYAAFLQQIGASGVRAFASAHDGRVYDAIHRLSVVKEERDADPQEIAAAQGALAALVAGPTPTSEAARLARLYWWTVEYGLIGTPTDYKLYGAGLLSSLGESHFCHAPAVAKLALSAACADVDYDITRPQPQLFVARDFEQLSEVLDQVCAGFAYRAGGLSALETARAADEVATVMLDSGLHVTGKVSAVHAAGAEPMLVAMQDACALGDRGMSLGGHGRSAYPNGLALVLGPLAGGRQLAALEPGELELAAGREGRMQLQLASGLRIDGRVHAVTRERGSVRAAVFMDASVMRGDQRLSGEADGTVVWLSGQRVVSVRAGAEDPSYWPEAEYPDVSAPARPAEQAQTRALRLLYERAMRARSCRGPAAERRLAAVHEALDRAHPNEWLLRWNLLEALQQLDLDPPRRERLVAELWRLERHFGGRHPIAMGLRYLGYGQAQ
jgi:phenylalanine-4-hydroxylase